MSCPKCGNDEVVSKAAAWDALTKIPPRTETHIKWLANIHKAASVIVADHPVTPDEETVCVYVRLCDLEALQTAFKQKYAEQ